jgi:hypothetical protein
MNGTSGFEEVQPSTSRSSSDYVLHEQRHQSGKGSSHVPRTQDLIALSTDISTKREMDSLYIYQIRAGGRRGFAISKLALQNSH